VTLVDEIDAVALTLAYEHQLDALADAVAQAVRQVFLDLDHLDRADIDEFVRNAKPITTGGAQEAADLASGYLATLTNDRLRTSPIDIPYVPFDSPFHRTWHQLKQEDPWDQARESGASVAEGIGYDAASDGASARMGQPGTKVMGYRRLLQPGACEWCQVVATKLYRTQQSATFGHLNCHCKPIAVPRDNDPTHKINQARLDELRKSGAVQRSTDAAARARARRRARPKGEMP
jgi:hypothetical protein